MTGSYAYTPYVWPMLAPPALLLALAVYAWRHRPAPGARPFVLLVLCIVPWAVGAALELAAVDPETKILWFRFESVWKLPVATAALWFALEYADLGRWLTRRTGRSWPFPRPFLLSCSSPAPGRELLSTASSRGGGPRRPRPCGPRPDRLRLRPRARRLAVFLWLFLRSPLHRWPAALCLCGHVAAARGYLIDGTDANPFAPMDATILGGTFTAAMYAVALVHFRMFELVPVARWTLVEQMRTASSSSTPGSASSTSTPRPRGSSALPASGPAAAPRATSCRRSRTRARGPKAREPHRPRSASARGPAARQYVLQLAPCGTGAASGSGTWS